MLGGRRMGYGMTCSTTPKDGVEQGGAKHHKNGAPPPPPPTGEVGGGGAQHLNRRVVEQYSTKERAND